MMILSDLFKEAWHAISIDPLVDSDDETGGDEYVREDYGKGFTSESMEAHSTETGIVVQRLNVINRLARRRSHEAPSLSSFMDTNPT
jgi:hypothetical protein